MCWGRGRTGRPAASSQKNNFSPLAQSQEKGCRASPRPRGTGAREEPPAETAQTLLLPRPPSSAHRWRRQHPATPGPAQLGTF